MLPTDFLYFYASSFIYFLGEFRELRTYADTGAIILFLFGRTCLCVYLRSTAIPMNFLVLNSQQEKPPCREVLGMWEALFKNVFNE